jgi:hypothetical protein
MTAKKDHSLFLRLTDEEKKMVGILKEKYAFNISCLVRKHIRDIYEQYTKQ